MPRASPLAALSSPSPATATVIGARPPSQASVPAKHAESWKLFVRGPRLAGGIPVAGRLLLVAPSATLTRVCPDLAQVLESCRAPGVREEQ